MEKGYHIINGLTREQWLENRKGGIGASCVGVLLGLDENKTVYQLWRELVGMDPKQTENMAMKRGHLLEDAVAKYYADETGACIKRGTDDDWLAVDNDRPFLRVSPDRIYWEEGAKHSPRNYRLLECKTTDVHLETVNGTEQPMAKWVAQLQYQMGVMRVQRGTIGWLRTWPRFGFGYQTHEFDAKLYNEEIVPRIEHFWKFNVLGGNEPTSTTVKDLALKFPESKAGFTIADEGIMGVCTDYAKVKHDIETLEKQKAELEVRIKDYMGETEQLLSPDNKTTIATWKSTAGGMDFDKKTFIAENPDLYRKYNTIEKKGTRTFLMKVKYSDRKNN